MKCQNCGNYEANFHYRLGVNGKITEQHLCGECARTMEGSLFTNSHAALGSTRMAESELFDGLFFGNVFSVPALLRGYPAGGVQSSPVVGESTEKHIPEDAGPDIKKRREINRLRSEMEAAVKEENFERAAVLRDEIYKLEKE